VVSVRTVQAHLQAVYGKLGVKSRTAAVREGRERGVIE
jgi:DNA-binding CsgD family transcriptional regulator